MKEIDIDNGFFHIKNIQDDSHLEIRRSKFNPYSKSDLHLFKSKSFINNQNLNNKNPCVIRNPRSCESNDINIVKKIYLQKIYLKINKYAGQ